jgi:hypothetical protein
MGDLPASGAALIPIQYPGREDRIERFAIFFDAVKGQPVSLPMGHVGGFEIQRQIGDDMGRWTDRSQEWYRHIAKRRCGSRVQSAVILGRVLMEKRSQQVLIAAIAGPAIIIQQLLDFHPIQ